MVESKKRVWATINLRAFQENLAKVNGLCPKSKIYPVIKSNAYGHGMEQIAAAALNSETNIAGFSVATIQEATDLRSLELDLPILLLNGFIDEGELRLCIELKLEPVIHSLYQLQFLKDFLSKQSLTGPVKFWVKMNTGMNRLGMTSAECQKVFQDLRSYSNIELVFMTHLAYADDIESLKSGEFTAKQLGRFSKACKHIESFYNGELETSIAASAGILTLPDTRKKYVRPGVMLYGSSPLAQKTGKNVGLQPVMSLFSRVISINEVPAGEAIGYNATYVCDKDKRVGTVSIGYGDGYPRSAKNGTPVLIKTQSRIFKTQLIGRVSMDMITIDLSEIDDADINDEVLLWGAGLCPDEVAKYTDTIAYELFCKVTKRVPLTYI
ncbi:MAG: alanine racemase [Gammaproteobacteria bacterium]|nr:alanine racemase [Gammaproteobacteria bacterium]